MAVVIKKHISIESSDGKKVWHVPDDLLVDVNDIKFIKLPRSHTAFCNLVTHGCTTLSPRPKDFSVTASIGYNQLLELRNKEQIKVLAQPACFLFKENKTKVKRPRL